MPQVALLYSTAAHYREINGLFSRDLSRLRGTLQAWSKTSSRSEVLSEHNLTGRMAQYPLIVVPETDDLEPAFKQELVSYVQRRRQPLARGTRAAALCSGVGRDAGRLTAIRARYLAHDGKLTPTKDQTQLAKLGKARAFGQIHATADRNSAAQPAASIAALGQGKIAATFFCLSRGYVSDRSETARAFLGGLVRELFPRPLVQVKGSSDVDVSVNRLNGRLAINLVNTAGPHADVNSPIFDSIPQVGPLELRVRVDRKPAPILLEPGGQPLAFAYGNGEARLTLPSLGIHSIILVE